MALLTLNLGIICELKICSFILRVTLHLKNRLRFAVKVCLTVSR